MFIITARVYQGYGHADAVIGVTETYEKAEELIDSIRDPEYPLCFEEIDGYQIMPPQIIEVNSKLNTLCVCLSEDGLDYSDS